MGSFGGRKKSENNSNNKNNSSKKKKGTKGKKARAKAKLDRQWGEVDIAAATVVVDNKKQSTTTTTTTIQRVGRSRLKNSKTVRIATQQKETTNDFMGRVSTSDEVVTVKNTSRKIDHPKTNMEDDHDDSSTSSVMSDSSQDDNDDDDDDVDDDQRERDGVDTTMDANPLNDLLDLLRNSKTKTGKMSKNQKTQDNDHRYMTIPQDHIEEQSDDSEISTNSDDSDMDSLSEGSCYDCVNDGKMETGDIQVGDDDNDTMLDNDQQTRFQWFRQRFHRPPLQESEFPMDKARSSVTTRIPIETNQSVDLHVSTPYGQTEDMTKLLSIATNQEWQNAALTTFSGINNIMLQRRWNRFYQRRNNVRLDRHKDKELKTNTPFMDNIQASMYSFLARYCDLFVTTCNSGNGQRNHKRDGKEQKQMHQIYLLHILNHVLTTQSEILRNNKLLKDGDNNSNGIGTNANDENAMDDVDQYRDQGFTRPTVLVLLPTRGTCHQFIKDLYRLVGAQMDNETEERFEADYGKLIDEEEGNENNDAKQQSDNEKERRRKEVLKQKGKEWNELFGDDANQDDDFKIGISLSTNMKKTKTTTTKNKKETTSKSLPAVSARLYTDFFKSDIIIASPLGLKILITKDDTETERNVDYLSSIEICLLQHSEVMLMQNWDHVNDILTLLNQQPKNNNNTDFSRVREYLLDDQGAHWRQLIVSTKFMDPYLISSFKRFSKSIAGSVKVRRKTPNDDAAIANVLRPIKQVFQRVPVQSFAQQCQARVEYFIKVLLPQIQKQKKRHIMIFIPSYFDFCSLRNVFLKREDVAFVSVTEYSRTSEIGRGRARFLQGRKPIMLYTGRAHYFHRHAIRGIKHLVFLGLPEQAEFYADYVNLIGSTATVTNRKLTEDDMETDVVQSSSTSCVVLFSKYEAHALERIVGSDNCSRILSSSKTTVMFHS
jgi:U3 small nucleolar RNA-associated protein 25